MVLNGISFFGGKFLLTAIVLVFIACNSDSNSRRTSESPVYVKPTVDRNGHYRRGYMRMPVSAAPNAAKKNIQSKFYYQTKGKYRAKLKKR